VLVIDDTTVNVRYMVDDVDAALEFYRDELGFEVLSSAAPAFADVRRGNLRLLLSGPKSSAGRPMDDGEQPSPGGWNRIHFLVDDLEAEVERLETTGASFRNPMVEGPGGKQILLVDPSGNFVELFQPAAR
jgi:predicted enzyme related to lactoylglutathione lyase